MDTNLIDPNFYETSDTPRPELLVACVLHLMSHYMSSSQEAGACAKLATIIERHLRALASLPDLAPVLRATCQQLSEHWVEITERAMPKPVKAGFLARFISGAKTAPDVNADIPDKTGRQNNTQSMLYLVPSHL